MDYAIDENILYIFTDWASRPALGKTPSRVGGMWIFFVECDKQGNLKEKDMSDYIGYVWATNQDMELQACINWLKVALSIDLSIYKKIIIVTDSQFITKNVNYAKFWQWDRAKRFSINWNPIIHKKQRKTLVKHMQEIYRRSSKKVEFEWVKWHSDNEYNKKADKAAVKWAQLWVQRKWSNTAVRRFFFKNPIWFKKWGYIPIHWEEVFIHIYSSRYLRSGWYRYNYELVSRDHQYFMTCGWIFYKSALSAEFIYSIKATDDGTNWIKEILSIEKKQDIRDQILKAWFEESIFL